MPLLLKQCIFFGSDIYFIGNTFFYLKKNSNFIGLTISDDLCTNSKLEVDRPKLNS